jgi:glycosyltransferase involved in cell wall biosynthesis
MATASNLALDATTVIVEAGSPWRHLDIDRFQEMKRTTGCRYAIFCYDIIPLQFPEFFPARHVARFRSYYDAAFPLTDLVIFGARTVEHDVRAYCADHGLSLGQSAVVPLGADPFHGRERGPADLPAGLVAGRYALLVGTIEPRKGHALLLRIWLRLLTEKIPEETGFRLVFVGRPGWMVGGLMRDLCDRKRIGGTIVVLEGASDATLDALYANAAFCLLPSTYEGYGLPIVEAFSHGKAVIASTGGAVPEVVGSLSPCIDLRDEEAWYDTLKAWITGGGSRLRFEEEIRRRFSHPTWDEAASLFFGAIGPEITGAMNVAGFSTCQE